MIASDKLIDTVIVHNKNPWNTAIGLHVYSCGQHREFIVVVFIQCEHSCVTAIPQSQWNSNCMKSDTQKYRFWIKRLQSLPASWVYRIKFFSYNSIISTWQQYYKAIKITVIEQYDKPRNGLFGLYFYYCEHNREFGVELFSLKYKYSRGTAIPPSHWNCNCTE